MREPLTKPRKYRVNNALDEHDDRHVREPVLFFVAVAMFRSATTRTHEKSTISATGFNCAATF
jgi:hypothetical protein